MAATLFPQPPETTVNRPSPLWLVLIGVLVVLSFVLPFAMFRNLDAWYGSFLFWSLATAAVVAISAIVSARWKD